MTIDPELLARKQHPMPATSDMKRRTWLLLVASGLALSCDSDARRKEEATKNRLVGAWLWELEQDGTQVRQVVVLSADRSFREYGKISRADLSARTEENVGEWFFDGTYFKRKYTHLDGKPLSSSRMTFATLRLEPSGDDEIVGIDDAQKRTIKYRRVGADTRP